MILNPVRRLSLQLRFFQATSSLLFLGAVGYGIYAWVHNEDFPVPRSETETLSAVRPYLFDVVLVDGAVLGQSEIADMVRPMRMVLERRIPGKSHHVRIAVYGAGLPFSINADRGMAGFISEEDSFFVDLRLLRTHKPLPGTRAQWWGSWMGHEAMHLVQKLRGDQMTAGSRGTEYDTDPMELEAAKEGASVANGLGVPYSWTFAGQPLQSEDPSAYRPYAQASTPDLIRVSTATTRRGTIILAWERAKAIFER